jgi:hypothetical protein
MSDSKHTPGPWEPGFYGYKDCAEPIIAIQHEGRCVCRISPKSLMDDEDLENARLIAAAPDLLDAAVQMLSWHDERARSANFRQCGCVDCDAFRPVVDKAKGGGR